MLQVHIVLLRWHDYGYWTLALYGVICAVSIKHVNETEEMVCVCMCVETSFFYYW